MRHSVLLGRHLTQDAHEHFYNPRNQERCARIVKI
jgi:hypothetical protein